MRLLRDGGGAAELSGGASPLAAGLVSCGGLLIAEYVAVSVAFDATALVRRAAWLSGIGYAAPLSFAVAAGVLLLARGIRSSLAALLRNPAALGNFRWPLLSLHLVLFAFFFELTRRVTSAEELLPGDPGPWIALWAIAGLASTFTLVLSAFTRGHLTDALRRFWPMLLVAAAVGAVAWGAGRAAEALWPVLSSLTLAAVAIVLRAVAGEVVERPEELIVGLTGFEVRIAPVCSGSEGIGLILVLIGTLLFVRRRELRFPVSLALLPLAAAAAWFANVLRIAALIGIGAHWSSEVAYGAFHSKAGWVFFCALAVGLAALARCRPFAAAGSDAADADAHPSNPVAAYLMPFVVAGAAALLAGAVLHDSRAADSFRFAAAAVALLIWRRAVRLELSWAAAILGVAAAAAGLLSLSAAALEPPRGAMLVLHLAGFVVAMPIVEELALRGFLFRRLISADFETVPARSVTLIAFAGSVLVSGAIHHAIIPAAVSGVFFTLAQIRRGRTGDAIAAHMFANALLAAYAAFAGRWEVCAGLA